MLTGAGLAVAGASMLALSAPALGVSAAYELVLFVPPPSTVAVDKYDSLVLTAPRLAVAEFYTLVLIGTAITPVILPFQ